VALTESVVLLNPPEVSIRLGFARVAVRPEDGFVVSVTVPLNPLRLITAMGVVHTTPVLQLTVTGVLGWIAKSWLVMTRLITNTLWNVSVKWMK
jgi:hypothetical protein